MKKMQYVLAVLLAAWATVGSAATLTLDPSLDQSGDIDATVCTEDASDAIQDCPGLLPLSGEDTFTIQILNPGFINSIADVLLVPNDIGLNFTSFHYQIQEPGPLMIASANGPGVNSAPPNAPVTVGIYNVIVDWTLPPGPPPSIAAQGGLTSAGYTIHVFTSFEPNPRFAAVPEPGTLLLMGAAVLAIVILRRRRVR
jgi:hypothetical protein